MQVWLGYTKEAHVTRVSGGGEAAGGMGRKVMNRSCRAFWAMGKTENFVLSQGRHMDSSRGGIGTQVPSRCYQGSKGRRLS